MFDSVQTATAGDTLGSAEGQFSLSLHFTWFTCAIILQLATFFVQKLPMCVLIDKHWGPFFLQIFQTPYTIQYLAKILLINNIIQVTIITLWEPASQCFHCDFCIFTISLFKFFINILADVINGGWWHLTILLCS